MNNISDFPNYIVNGKKKNSLNFKDVTKDIDKLTISKESIYQVMQYGYILGENTLFEEVKREQVIDNDKINEKYFSTKVESDISKQYFNLLVKEVEEFVGTSKNIGILLSGGLDSRILAGVLKHVQSYSKFDVTALTWGLKNSRDVIYSKQIANAYSWDVNVLYQNVDTLKSNIITIADIGCETNPVNLHSMKDISSMDFDLILAGSFGDALGRGEYSGDYAETMKTLTQRANDNFGFFKNQFSKHCIDQISEYDQSFYKKYSGIEPNKVKEITMLNNNHMKYLQASMSIIGDKIPLKQLFSSYDLIGLALNIDYDYRHNILYNELLKLLPEGIGEIPWARTGKRFNGNAELDPEDNYLPNHHEYSKWLQVISNSTLNDIDFELVEDLGIFNLDIIKKSMRIVRNRKHQKLDRIDRNIVWLSAFSRLVKNINVTIPEKSYKRTFKDRINSKTFRLKNKIVELKQDN